MGGVASTPGKAKFQYFPLKARGFPILLALEVGNVDYDGEVVQFKDWKEMKASGACPMGYLPLLTLPDGTKVNETNACLVAAGIRGKLLGSSDSDKSVSVMLACKSAEVFTEFTKVHPTMFSVEGWNDEKKAALETWATDKNKKYLDQFEDLCNDDGKFTADGNTIGELSVFHLLYHFKCCGFLTEFTPKLNKFYARLMEIEAVKKCCENKTKMGELADYVVPVPGKEAQPDTAPQSPPATMRAIVNTGYGDTAAVLSLTSDRLLPTLPEGGDPFVLVKVHAAALNPIDYKIIEGHMKQMWGEVPFPRVPGCDVSGVVVQASAACTRLKVGDEVFADYPRNLMGKGDGSLAEYVVMPEIFACAKPASLTHEQAAAIPLAALTSLQVLKRHGGLQAGGKVLVLAGSGGTGTFALQIAKILGAAQVATTSSNEELCKSLGADQVINYRNGEDFGELLAGQDFDIIYDCAGGQEAWDKGKKVLKAGGHYLTIAGPPIKEEDHDGFKWKFCITETGTPAGLEDLQQLAEFAESGKLKPVLDPSSPYTLEKAIEAFAMQKSGRAKGKLVVKVV